MPPSLQAIVDNGLCHGCGGCAASLPVGRIDMVCKDGFLRPHAEPPLSGEEDAVVREVCSGLILEHEPGRKHYDPLWGPVQALRTGHSTDPDIRYAGSSGGVLSTVATFLMQAGEVDFVLQVAASKDDPIANTPRPSIGRDDVLAAAGSRYAPSATLAGLQRHLASGARFAVVGKPCDIASLRRMARRDPRIDRQIPFFLSFMCAGVPSRRGTEAVLKALGVDYEELIAFAYRGRGWPGYTRAMLKGGEERTMTYNEAWGGILNRHLQPRCKICPDGTGEFADIVCADAWYSKDGYPDFSEAEGRSLIVSRTQIGEKLIERMLKAGAIEADPLPLGDIELMQPYQADRKRMILPRLTALRVLGRLTPRYRRLRLGELAAKSGIRPVLRNFAGTLARAVGGKFNA